MRAACLAEIAACAWETARFESTKDLAKLAEAARSIRLKRYPDPRYIGTLTQEITSNSNRPWFALSMDDGGIDRCSRITQRAILLAERIGYSLLTRVWELSKGTAGFDLVTRKYVLSGRIVGACKLASYEGFAHWLEYRPASIVDYMIDKDSNALWDKVLQRWEMPSIPTVADVICSGCFTQGMERIHALDRAKQGDNPFLSYENWDESHFHLRAKMEPAIIRVLEKQERRSDGSIFRTKDDLTRLMESLVKAGARAVGVKKNTVDNLFDWRNKRVQRSDNA